MPAFWNRNRLTEKLGIEYPIIQGPLGGLSSQRLTAAVSNFGGLGSFGATRRGVLTKLDTHLAEHMGQLVAYARVNGIVPPWSQ